MDNKNEHEPHFPLSERIKGIPGIFGIRVEEEANFRVIEEEGDSIEIRDYEPTLIARTFVQGSRSDAMNEAFNRLASYIFGENLEDRKIEMTNPVFQASAQGSPLTAEGASEGSPSGWVVAFCLPRDLSWANAPKPANDDVEIAEIPRRLVAVKRFSGTSSGENIEAALEELREWITGSSFEEVSKPVFAQYDPPFAIPLLRRNEIQIEVR